MLSVDAGEANVSATFSVVGAVNLIATKLDPSEIQKNGIANASSYVSKTLVFRH
jgi:hypothetical protein